jgi:hypothetical protein
MRKPDLSKVAEAGLLTLFGLAAVYITVAATIFGGTAPPAISHPIMHSLPKTSPS